jgi:hypothetical protein
MKIRPVGVDVLLALYLQCDIFLCIMLSCCQKFGDITITYMWAYHNDCVECMGPK